MDRRYLSCIAENYGGGPVGVETLSAALSEQRDVLEEVVEPYLLQQGLLQRTTRGQGLNPGRLRLSWSATAGEAAAARSSRTSRGGGSLNGAGSLSGWLVGQEHL